MTADTVVQQRSAEEVFGLLGNPLRVGILRALAETPAEAVRFAPLRKRVDESDSGKFNYHLGKLLGSFVRKVDEGGYELTDAGRQVIGALHAGTYTDAVTLEPVPVDGDCHACGAALSATYEDEHVVVSCPDCGEFENRHGFPPGTVDQFDRAELPAAFDRWLRTSFGRIVAGFCTTCSGRLEAEIVTEDDDAMGDHDYAVAGAHYSCERCGSDAWSSVYLPLVYHPAAIAFFYDHGVDVTTAPTWEVAAAAADWAVELLDDDPVRVQVTAPADDEELVATLDETASVSAVERRPR